jgi:iron(III) transport system ATP-binding protein
MVFQDQALFPHLTVGQNIEFGLNGASKNERRDRVQAVLDQVGLGDYAGRYPHTLSGGQQQRVALARALAPQPSVMLFDEPFVGLDPRLRATLRAETLALLSASGAAVLFVTHDPEEALALGDRVAILRHGRVVQIDTPRACYERPVDREAALALGDANRFCGVMRDGMVMTPVGSIPVLNNGEGGEVDVLIRPEHLLLSAEGAPATVRNVTFLGPLTQVEVATAGATARVLLVNRKPPRPGDTVCIGVCAEHALIFPSEKDR